VGDLEEAAIRLGSKVSTDGTVPCVSLDPYYWQFWIQPNHGEGYREGSMVLLLAFIDVAQLVQTIQMERVGTRVVWLPTCTRAIFGQGADGDGVW
jgi:hypothetical protein